MIIAGYVFLFTNYSSLNGHTVCVFKNISGFACPSCGSTRATILLLHGHVLDSIYMNPLALFTNIIIIISCFWMMMNIFQSKDTYLVFMKKSWPTYLKISLFALVLINWIWNIYKGL